MKKTYQGTVVESSLPLDSIIFHEEQISKPEKPTNPAREVKPKRTPGKR